MPPDAKLRRSRALGLYWLETADVKLEVHPTNGSFNIRRTRTPESQLAGPQKKYPSTEDSIKIVMEYLKTRDLLPNDGYLREFSDAANGRSNVRVWFGREIDGYKTWGAGDRLIVDIGPGGEVFKLRKSWQQLVPYKTWPMLRLRLGYLRMELTTWLASSSPLAKTAA